MPTQNLYIVEKQVHAEDGKFISVIGVYNSYKKAERDINMIISYDEHNNELEKNDDYTRSGDIYASALLFQSLIEKGKKSDKSRMVHYRIRKFMTNHISSVGDILRLHEVEDNIRKRNN